MPYDREAARLVHMGRHVAAPTLRLSPVLVAVWCGRYVHTGYSPASGPRDGHGDGVGTCHMTVVLGCTVIFLPPKKLLGILLEYGV